MIRFLPVSLTTILVEVADLDETLALFASLNADPIDGIEEAVPAARTVMIRFRPDVVSAVQLATAISRRDLSVKPEPSDKLVEIAVHYDGEDLADVAGHTGLSVEEVIRRHTESEFTVAFCGFAPGFGYLAGGDPALHVPRRQSPRTRIPAGSVALAGAFSGVYPQASPGGWQIIGTTPDKMWDIDREPGALFQPGYRVRFYDIAKRQPPVAIDTGKPVAVKDDRALEAGPHFKVLAAPLRRRFRISAASARPARVSRLPARSIRQRSMPPTASPAILAARPVLNSSSAASPSKARPARSSALPVRPAR